MHLSKPNVTFDWTINVSNLISILIGLVVVISSYYSLKGEVETARAVNETRFELIDKMFSNQNQTNMITSQKIEQVHKDLTNQLQNSTEDIKADIRELRSDVITVSPRRTITVPQRKIDLNP